MKHRVLKARAGFSVVEVLAAIALIAVAMIPLYQLQRALADAAFRLEQSAAALEAKENALAWLETVNPQLQPDGEIMIGGWLVRWQARPVATVPIARGYLGESIHSVGLYDVEVRMERNGRSDSFTVRKIGWEQVRDPLGFIESEPTGPARREG